VRKGKKMVLDVPVPVAQLCGGGAQHLTWEAGGRGELSRVGGGGRSVLQLRCP
jgi:hypothetical protein